MKSFFKLALLLAAVSVHLSDAANILALAIIPSYSHQIPILAITKALAARGHNVTVITAHPSKVPIPNHTEIDMSESYKLIKGLGMNLTSKIYPFEMIKRTLTAMPILVEAQLKSPVIRNFMSWAKDVKFDVVLYECAYLSSFLGLAHVLGSPPVIAVATIDSNWPFSSTVGSSLNLATGPIWLPYTDHMTFYERLNNVAMLLWFIYLRDWYMFPEYDRITHEVFGEGLPSAKEMERNMSLLIHCASGSMYYPQAYTPNVHRIGATHVQKPKPLPEDMEKWVSEADDGVIYFSLGTNMQGTCMPVEIREAFVTVFSQLKNYRVIWKWESDQYFPGQPENVMFKKWVPQQHVLAHPKVKLFITQGGMQSLEESVHFGVPIVGIPLFGDQFTNIHKLVTVEAGIGLDFEYLNNNTIFTAVNAVLHDPKYRNNMRRLSDISKDTVLPPVDQAVWWVEYVIRYNGARHLRPATLDLHWTQYYLLDIAAFVIAITSIIVFSVFKLVEIIYRQYTLHTLNEVKQKKRQ